MNMRRDDLVERIIWILIFVGLFSGASFSQPAQEWKKLTTSNNELSLSLPKDFNVFNGDDRFTLFSESAGAWISISNDRVDNTKKYVKELKLTSSDRWKLNEYDMSGFVVRGLTFDNEKGYMTHLYIASSKNYYRISASANSKNSPGLVRFLQSIQLGG